MFATIKMIFKMFMAGYRVSKLGGLDIYLNKKLTNGEYVEKLNVESVPVFILTDDDAVLSTGFRFGIVTTVGLTSFTKKIVIAVEKLAYDIGIDKYIIYHEMGHIYNEILTKKGICERTLDDEVNADLYAVKMMGLEETIKSMKILASQKNVDATEIYERIYQIENR
jgi:hypothetical protein